jgi:acetylornithine deacetylase
MARVITALETYANEVAPRLGSHPRCGPPTLSVGTIHGGMSVNIVPDRCVIEIDRRLMPDEAALETYQSIIEHVAAAAGTGGIEHDRPFSINTGLTDGRNQSLAERLLKAIRPLRPAAETIGVAYGTDAATISAAGVPSVVFGPGSIDQAHTADEWIDVDQLRAAGDALYSFGAG